PGRQRGRALDVGGPRMNRLADETSPYLLQHAENPVDWFPWGEEALERARAEDKPILLSIGYAACHWCHVMAHESFENAETGALVDALKESAAISPSADPLTESLLGEAARGLARQFDPEWGGFGRAPKFPPASTLEFLLRRHRANDEEALAMVTRTLDGMAAGGMYDLLGGGFHRYSVDEQWLVPHFEKMLYDNAL